MIIANANSTGVAIESSTASTAKPLREELPWFRRLNTHFIVGVSVVLLTTLAISQYLILSKLESTIIREEISSTELLANGLMSSLQTLMLSGDGDHARDWINRLSENSKIKTLQVIRRDGSEAFLDDKTIAKVNGYMESDFFRRPSLPGNRITDISQEAFALAANGSEKFIMNEKSESLTFLLPVRSEDACLGCHGYEDDPVRGVLRITTSTTQAQHRIAEARRNSVTYGILTSIITGLLLFLFIRRQVLSPLEEIASATSRVTSGDFETHIEVQSQNELGVLGGAFNHMTESLRNTTVSKRYVESVMNSLGEMVFVTDKEQKITTINPAVTETLEYRAEELVGKPMSILVNGGNFPTMEDDHRTLNNGKARNIECTFSGKDGKLIPVLATFSHLRQGESESFGIVLAGRDITIQKKAERELKLTAKVMENDSNAILICDHMANIVLINPAFTEITGYSAEEIIGQNPRILSSGRQPKEFYQQMWETLLKEDHWEGEIWNRRKNGEIYPEYLSVTVIRNDAGEVANFVSLFTDITKQKQVEQKLAHMAHHDVLTGLPNRALFTDRLTNLINQYPRYKKKSGLMFIDIDGFKAVNDNFGHDIGDELLVTLADLLGHCIRKSDTLARVGGDEFVIILEKITSLENITRMAEKILKLFEAPLMIEGKSCNVGASIGIAIHPDDSDNADDLVKKADTAMYQAKTSGKGQYCIYSKACIVKKD